MAPKLWAGCWLLALSLGGAGGCAEQTDSPPRSVSVAGAPVSVAGMASHSGSAGAASAGGAGSPSGGMVGASGTAAVAGQLGVAGTDTEPSGGEGGAGIGACDCDDGNPCTTDGCLLGVCSHTSNAASCADDADPCTDDVCMVGVCRHVDNKTCACKLDTQCDDTNPCTDDECAANQCTHTNNKAACATDNVSCTVDVCENGACAHKDNGTCGVGTPFVVDNFNSYPDWVAGKTTPDQRTIVVTGLNASNLEGNQDVYLAEADTATIEFPLASMVGLGKLRIKLKSEQANTGGMIFVGLWNGATWAEKPLGNYGTVPTVDYATLDVNTADFSQKLADVTKMRLRFAVTGGEKVWRVDDISAAK
jgi:hypothetical protein